MPQNTRFEYNPPQGPLKIIHRDEDLLVLSKPSGLLSVPGRDPAHTDCLELRAKAEFPQALLTHRLDRGTSGIMVMAMNKRAQSLLGKHFERRLIKKTYIARVWGHVAGESGLIDLPLICDWPNRPLQMVCYEHGKASQTQWKVLERSPSPSLRGAGDEPIQKPDVQKVDCFANARNDNEIKTTLMELNPLTGRSHQLRVHMKALGHPILGDDFYAHEAARAAAPRLMLHAQAIELHHPKDGERVRFED